MQVVMAEGCFALVGHRLLIALLLVIRSAFGHDFAIAIGATAMKNDTVKHASERAGLMSASYSAAGSSRSGKVSLRLLRRVERPQFRVAAVRFWQSGPRGS